jgi:hypothetical protein
VWIASAMSDGDSAKAKQTGGEPFEVSTPDGGTREQGPRRYGQAFGLLVVKVDAPALRMARAGYRIEG